MKPKYLIPLALVIVLILAMFITTKIKNRVRYETREINRCTITQFVEASGTINPVNTVSVGSTVSGLIKDRYVDYKSQVKKGQILAQIDPATFEATVKQNEAQIANAQANLAKLQAIAEYDQKTYQRYADSYI